MDNKYKIILGHYGAKNQLLKTCEECGELISAIMKHVTEGGSAENIISEIADVYIMIQQLILIYGAEKVSPEIERKLQRQVKRIKK